MHNGRLYYTDRNTGCSFVDLTTRGAVQGKKSSTERDSYAFQNNVIPYYGRGISYGAISNTLERDKAGYWWWGKKYNGKGIYRFRDNQIYPTQKEAEGAALPAPVVLSNVTFSAFAIDEDRGFLYIYRTTDGPGLVVYNLPSITETVSMTATPVKYIPMDADPVNTTESEGLFITQFALDKETGRLYFAYRPNTGDTSGVRPGINYYDPADQKVHHYGDAEELGTGIVINPNHTKLF